MALLLSVGCAIVEAHAPDTSYLRAVVSKQALELRFTFDIATLYKIERLDQDGDGKVTREEAESASPEIAGFLRRAITLELNGQMAELGAFERLGWPVDAGDVVEEKNYGQTLLHLTFRQETPKLIEDFYILYEVYGQLGAAHRTVANIEQEGKNLEVVFNQFEPDYVYDTYWRPGAEPLKPGPPTPEIKQIFRLGASDALGIWWMPITMLLAYALTLHWTDDRCCKWLLWMAFWFWLLVFATDSNPSPELGARTVGMVAGWWIMAFVLWPLRSLARSLRKARGQQRSEAS